MAVRMTRWESAVVQEARRLGWAVFYPAFPDAATQIRNTVKGAKKFLGKDRTDALFGVLASAATSAACGPGCPASINNPAPCEGCPHTGLAQRDTSANASAAQ